MNRRGGVALLIVALAALPGCDPDPPPPATKAAGRVKPFERILTASTGPAAIVDLAWGGPLAQRLLAALRSDGRIDVYRPGERPEPVATIPKAEPKGTTLAVLGGGAMVSGDAKGLVAWSVEPGGCKRLGRLDCGGVARLLASPGDSDEGYAGLRDGSVVRFRIREGEPPIQSTAEHRPEEAGSAPVEALTMVDEGRGVAVRWDDGRSARLRRDLGPSAAEGSSPTIAEAHQGRLRARIVPGPALVVDEPGERRPPSRLGLGRRPSSLAFLGGGRTLVVALDGEFLLVNVASAGPIAPEAPRVVAAEGPALVSADPDGLAARVALADASGRLEIVGAEALAGRGAERPGDEIPELAFLPWKGLRKPRGAAGSSERRLPEAPRPGGDPGEPEALELLKLAAGEASRSGRPDREADLRRWRGRALIPELDAAEGRRDPRRIAEGIAELARASALYQSSRPPLPRQARICDAERAWALLTIGEAREADAALKPAVALAADDPVLGQAPELDAIAGAVLAAREEWTAAAGRFERALRLLSPGDREPLRRRMALCRINALAASGKLGEVADLTESPGWDLGDAEIRLRGLTARFRVGRSVAPALVEGPQNAHIRGRIEAVGERIFAADDPLAEAAEAYRRAGRPRLGAEAALERAEVLERREILGEAQEIYESIVRAPLPPPDRSESAAGPSAEVRRRADRGLARCLIASGRAESALMAIEQASLVDWLAEAGEAAVRSSPIALPTEAAEGLLALRKARAEAGPDAPGVREQEARLAAEGRLIVQGDPTAPIDVPALRLSEGEAAIVFADLGPEAVAGFLVRKDRPVEVRRLPLSRPELRKAIASWRKGLGDGGRGVLPNDPLPGMGAVSTLSVEPGPSKLAATAARPVGPSWDAYLDEALIEPFSSRLQGISRLIVVPTGEIAALPIEAIGRSTRLLARLRVAYVPSLRVLQARREDGRLVVSAGSESLWLSAPGSASPIVGGRASIELSGVDARPSRLFGLSLADCGLIRLSAPATLDPRRTPWGRADLRLAPDVRPPWADGRLTSTDLLRLPLRARVLVLDVGDPSARDAVAGLGLRSLARDGLAAGSESVLVGLWDVPAGSSLALLSEFRSKLSEGKSPSDALDLARRALARDPKTRDPVHWAGFVLYGAP